MTPTTCHGRYSRDKRQLSFIKEIVTCHCVVGASYIVYTDAITGENPFLFPSKKGKTATGIDCLNSAPVDSRREGLYFSVLAWPAMPSTPSFFC